MGRPSRHTPEVRERGVRMVSEHEGEHVSQWAAIRSIAAKIGCTAETLRKWVRRVERDEGRPPGLTTDERQRPKDLERENRELKRTNEILRKASAFFAQAELDRRAKCWSRSSTRTARTESSRSVTDEPDGLVRIVAALVNATTSPEVEIVTLLNTAPYDVRLDGWALVDTQKKQLPLSGELAAGSTRAVRIEQPLALSNQGGIISLLDDKGLKVDGLSYTRDQARHPGWTIVF